MDLRNYHIGDIKSDDIIVSLRNGKKDYRVRLYDETPIVLCWEYWNGLKKGNEQDAEKIPTIAQNDDMVDGYKIGTNLYFQKEPNKVIESLKASTIPSNIVPFHLIREEEIVKLYQYSSWLKIKGIETNKFMDLSTLQYDFQEAYPGYIDISGCERYKEILSLVPLEYKKEVIAGTDPAHDGIRKIVLIQKTQIDSIILKQQFIQPDNLKTVLRKGKVDDCYFTGKENSWELNPANPDSDVLKKMKDLHVIRDFKIEG